MTPPPGPRPTSAAAPDPPAPGPGWRVLLPGLLLLHASNPLAWGQAPPALWVPAAGIGLALIAWFGPRAALLIALDGLLVALQAHLTGSLPARGGPWHGLGLAVGDGLLRALELALAWWLYHRVARGARLLSDPRSAVLFLFLVPGAVTGLFAVARVALFG